MNELMHMSFVVTKLTIHITRVFCFDIHSELIAEISMQFAA